MLGKEAAVFVPSGTMANQIALRVHCDHGHAFICEKDCHIYQYEQGAFAALSGLVAQTVAGPGGSMQIDQMEGVVHADNDHSFRTKLLCVENTHNRWGGRVQPDEDVQRLCATGRNRSGWRPTWTVLASGTRRLRRTQVKPNLPQHLTA